MASGYKFSLVRALSWCCVFFLASEPLVSVWESFGITEGFSIWPVLFTLSFFFALPCIISCFQFVWTAVEEVREVDSPDTFQESGALYATQTQVKLNFGNWKKCSIAQMKLEMSCLTFLVLSLPRGSCCHSSFFVCLSVSRIIKCIHISC